MQIIRVKLSLAVQQRQLFIRHRVDARFWRLRGTHCSGRRSSSCDSCGRRHSWRRDRLAARNQSTQTLSKNGIKSERTKHVDIKYHFVTDEVAAGRVQLEWIPTAQQLADVLTKALGNQQHRQLSSQLMVTASPARQ